VAEALNVARCMRQPVVLNETPGDGAEEAEAFLGGSPAMLEACKAIGRVSGKDVPVLITGESGTGKELAARAVYQHSSRAMAPYLAVNCAAIPESLLESEFFGHEKGAFTGADRRRVGKFEQCTGGTILLDEIGDMPLALQGKILRLLQEQTFQRVGGSDSVHTDVRVLAATHRDLRSLVAEGKFRADLFYRLAVVTIHLPPLRERAEDVPILVRHLLARYNREFGKDVREIEPEAMARLRAYSWPGNIRELQSALKQALLRASGTVLLSRFLPDLLSVPASSTVGAPVLDLEAFIGRQLTRDSGDLYAKTHREVDRLLFTLVLDQTGGNYREAAKLLGIARQTLRTKLRAIGLRVTSSVASDEGDLLLAE
jgi:two-component system nitrogen regulation response regulator GlnG